MKKIILALLAIAALYLIGCNKQLINLNYKFKKFIILIVIVAMKLIAGESIQMEIKYK